MKSIILLVEVSLALSKHNNEYNCSKYEYNSQILSQSFSLYLLTIFPHCHTIGILSYKLTLHFPKRAKKDAPTWNTFCFGSSNRSFHFGKSLGHVISESIIFLSNNFLKEQFFIFGFFSPFYPRYPIDEERKTASEKEKKKKKKQEEKKKEERKSP